jgi:hypothetical protein
MGRNMGMIALPVLLMTASLVLSPLSHMPIIATSGRLDLYEAVIRYQIKSWQLPAHTYCIKINGVDAEKVLLDHLRPLHARGASACHKLNQKPAMPIVDAKRKESVIFYLGDIRNVSDSEVDVDGGYYCGDLCMAEGTYRVINERSGWRVERFEARFTL